MARLSKQARAGYRRFSTQLSTVTGFRQNNALLALKTDLGEYFSIMKVNKPSTVIPSSILMLGRILESCPLLTDIIAHLAGHVEPKKSGNGLRNLATRLLAIGVAAHKGMNGGRLRLKKFVDQLGGLEMARKRSKADTRKLGKKWSKLYRRSVYEPLHDGLCAVTAVFEEDLCSLAMDTTVPRGPRRAFPNLAGLGGNGRPALPLLPMAGAVPRLPAPQRRSSSPLRGLGAAGAGAPPARFHAPRVSHSRTPSPLGPRHDGHGGGVAVATAPVPAAVGATPSPVALRRSGRLQDTSRSVTPIPVPASPRDLVERDPLQPAPLLPFATDSSGDRRAEENAANIVEEGEEDEFFDAMEQLPLPRRSLRLRAQALGGTSSSTSYVSALSSQSTTPSPPSSLSKKSMEREKNVTPKSPVVVRSAHRMPSGVTVQRFPRYYLRDVSSDEERERKDREMLASRLRVVATTKSGGERKRGTTGALNGGVKSAVMGDETPKRRSPKGRKRLFVVEGIEERGRRESEEKEGENAEDLVPEPMHKRARRSLRRSTPVKWSEDSSDDEEQKEMDRRHLEDRREVAREMREQQRLQREEAEREAEMQREGDGEVPMDLEEEVADGERGDNEDMEERMEVEENADNGEGVIPRRH